MHRECRERFPRHRLQRKRLVSDLGMHHGTCVTHAPWCISGSLTRGDEKNVPGIPGACTTRNFTYLARCPYSNTLTAVPVYFCGIRVYFCGIPLCCCHIFRRHACHFIKRYARHVIRRDPCHFIRRDVRHISRRYICGGIILSCHPVWWGRGRKTDHWK